MVFLLVGFSSSLSAIPSFPPHLVGTTAAVSALLERVLPGSSAHFVLSIAPTCPGVANGTNCFTLADSSDGDGAQTVITGTTASELTGGLGVYLREYCGMTIGWKRGGGRHVFTPSTWPRIGTTSVSRPRKVPYSHVTQVCTHSYTLVWHDWGEWEHFIDWMALAGHNSIVAPTGQEEVQYKVLTEQFGVSDMDVRNWTNGPARDDVVYLGCWRFPVMYCQHWHGQTTRSGMNCRMIFTLARCLIKFQMLTIPSTQLRATVH